MFHFKNPEIQDLFQWSTNIVLVFEDVELIGEEVHFSNNKRDSITRIINEDLEVTIPDILLQKAMPLEVYLFFRDNSERFTRKREIVRVLARPKPEDYVYTDEEVALWETKVDKYQGIEHARKFLGIDEAGYVTPMSISNVPGGTEGDKTYVYTQGSASTSWLIYHNMGKFPSVTVIDSANSIVFGEVTYIDENTLEINFSGAFSGKAFLN